MIVGAGLSVSATADLLIFSRTKVPRAYSERPAAVLRTETPCSWGQWRMARLVRADRSWGYGKSDNHSVQLWWADKHLRMHKMWKLEADGLEQQKSTVGTAAVGTGSPKLDSCEDWKSISLWSDESWFLLRHTDGRVRIWQQQHESMDPTCRVSTVQDGGCSVMVWAMIYWHTLGLLIPIDQHFNATVYLRIFPFISTMHPSSNGYFQHGNALCHKAKVILNWFQEHDTKFNVAFPVTGSESNRTHLGFGRTGDSQHECAGDKSAEIVWCNHVNRE